MERCFVKFPTGVAHLDLGPALMTESVRLEQFFPKSDATVVVANLAPEEQAAARANGATIYADFQFRPATLPNTVNPFDFAPRARFWEMVAEVQPAGPKPWDGKSLAEVLASLQLSEAWKITRGSGATVIIVDSGIDDMAAEFPVARRSSLSFSPAYAEGPWGDKLGHGSMVASVAAGCADAGGKWDGVAPEATLFSARTTYQASDLYAIYDHIITLRKNGQLSGPVVINNSYQATQCASDGRLPKDHPYADIVRSVVQLGIPMIFSAGNNHADMMCGNDPGACGPNTIWAVNSLDEVISVGAVNWDNSNTVGGHANSSRGPGEWATQFPKPDLVAPCYGEVLWGHTYRSLEWWGTSGSSPIVAGVVALMQSRAHAKGAILTPADIGQILRNTADRIPGAATACVGKGRVNPTAAVQAV